jgi:hypothetical protein
MPDISDVTTKQQWQASGEREHARPDLNQVPENPPVEQEDFDRGKDKLERVIAK